MLAALPFLLKWCRLVQLVSLKRIDNVGLWCAWTFMGESNFLSFEAVTGEHFHCCGSNYCEALHTERLLEGMRALPITCSQKNSIEIQISDYVSWHHCMHLGKLWRPTEPLWEIHDAWMNWINLPSWLCPCWHHGSGPICITMHRSWVQHLKVCIKRHTFLTHFLLSCAHGYHFEHEVWPIASLLNS